MSQHKLHNNKSKPASRRSLSCLRGQLFEGQQASWSEQGTNQRVKGFRRNLEPHSQKAPRWLALTSMPLKSSRQWLGNPRLRSPLPYLLGQWLPNLLTLNHLHQGVKKKKLDFLNYTSSWHIFSLTVCIAALEKGASFRKILCQDDSIFHKKLGQLHGWKEVCIQHLEIFSYIS